MRPKSKSKARTCEGSAGSARKSEINATNVGHNLWQHLVPQGTNKSSKRRTPFLKPPCYKQKTQAVIKLLDVLLCYGPLALVIERFLYN